MAFAVDPLLVLVLTLNFLLLGTSRLRAAIGASALQGALLGAIAVTLHGVPALRPIAVRVPQWRYASYGSWRRDSVRRCAAIPQAGAISFTSGM